MAGARGADQTQFLHLAGFVRVVVVRLATVVVVGAAPHDCVEKHSESGQRREELTAEHWRDGPEPTAKMRRHFRLYRTQIARSMTEIGCQAVVGGW